MRQQPGVIATRAGWTGGNIPDPTEASPRSHAEAVEIVFDPEQTSLVNRQVDDIGTEYRSAIFYTSDEQKRVAEDTIAGVDASGLWPGKVVTEIKPAVSCGRQRNGARSAQQKALILPDPERG